MQKTLWGTRNKVTLSYKKTKSEDKYKISTLCSEIGREIDET